MAIRTPIAQQASTERHCIFLLSPGNASGVKGQRLFNPDSQFELALRLRESGAPLGAVYEFISSLYFRGKLQYAEYFQCPPPGVAGVHVITGAGLMLPDTVVSIDQFRRLSAIAIDADNPDYRLPLHRDLCRLQEVANSETNVILLGSIATSKYITPLLSVFGEQLLFPRDFVGCGDMSRGSLLLKCCSSGSPLVYAPAAGLALNRKPTRKKLKKRLYISLSK